MACGVVGRPYLMPDEFILGFFSPFWDKNCCKLFILLVNEGFYSSLSMFLFDNC
jgi:hypothetical protein